MQSVQIESELLVLEIAAGRQKFRARIMGLNRAEKHASLIDAEVTVRGACGALFNDKRQLVGIQLWVPSVDEMHIEEAARSHPFTLPIGLPNS